MLQCDWSGLSFQVLLTESAYIFEVECGLYGFGFVTKAVEGPHRPTVDVLFYLWTFFLIFKTLLCARTGQRVGFWWLALPSHLVEIRSFLFLKALYSELQASWPTYLHLPSHWMNAGLTDACRCTWPFSWVLGIDQKPSDWKAWRFLLTEPSAWPPTTSGGVYVSLTCSLP